MDNITETPAGTDKQTRLTLRIVEFNSMLDGGGTDDRSVNLAKGLTQLGHRICIAGPDGREYSHVIRKLGLPFYPIPPKRPLSIATIAALVKTFRQERPHILQVKHGRDYWPAIIAAALSGTHPRVVLCRHLAKSPQSWLSRQFLLNNCDAMVAVSNCVSKVLRDGGREPHSPEPERRYRPPMKGDLSKIHVIYGGFDIDRFIPGEHSYLRKEWGLEPEHFAFGLVGKYDFPRGKGHREFLKAAAIITERIPNARFLIIGRGSMESLLREDIEGLSLSGKALLTPYSNDMPAAMNAIDCLVHPNMGTEALPGVIVEAQACGKPVITTDLDGNPEALAVTGCGQLIKPESIDELAAAMLNQARTPPFDMPKRMEMHRTIKSYFCIKHAAVNFANLYSQIVAKPPLPGMQNTENGRTEKHEPAFYTALTPFRELFASGTPILTYHKLGPRPRGVRMKGLYVGNSLFEKQLSEFAVDGYKTTGLSSLGGSQPVNGRCFVITFDDGFRSAFDHGLEPLARYDFKAISFIASGYIGKMSEWQRIRGEVLEPMMDECQVREWLAAGHEIGAHTVSHPRLTKITKEKAREEITAGKKRLEDLFGIGIKHFCYPYGDWNKQVCELVADAGFETACTTDFGINTPATPRLELRRITARYRSRSVRNLLRELFARK